MAVKKSRQYTMTLYKSDDDDDDVHGDENDGDRV